MYNYEYDAEGNRTRRTKIATCDYEEYSYDYRNRLTDVTFKDSSDTVTKRVGYTYDVLNRRIGKEIDADADNTYETVERYVYDGENVALVFDGSGTLVQRYLHGAGVDDVVAEEDGSGNVSWMLPDEQGSVRDVISSSTTSLDHIVYDGFGNVASRTGTEPLRYAYTGRELDGETGLYYYRRRYYDPQVGRFISQDPKGFAAGDGNLYRYVKNSTPNLRDPSGLEPDQNQSPEWSEGGIYPTDNGEWGVYRGITEGGNPIFELPPTLTAEDSVWQEKQEQHYENWVAAQQSISDAVQQARQGAATADAIYAEFLNAVGGYWAADATHQQWIADNAKGLAFVGAVRGYFVNTPSNMILGLGDLADRTFNPVRQPFAYKWHSGREWMA